MKIFGKHIISVWMLVLPLVSCVKDEFYTDGPLSGDETELAATIGFPTFAPALETRTAGDAIKEINSLWLMVYEKDENDSWRLEEGGKIRITAEEHHLTTGLADNTRPDGEEQYETETGHASFRFRHKNGQYKVYAVANCDLDTLDSKYLDTPEKLKNLQLRWDKDKIQNNSEMFGCFTNDKSYAGSGDETVTISPNRTIHAWIRRAASKVTVAYDGSKLAEGVTIYLMSVTVKDIPLRCPLGAENIEPDSLIDGDMIKYYEGDTPPPAIDFITGYKATVTNKTAVDLSAHEDTAPALFFYENMQGVHPDNDKRQKDTDNDDKLDYTFKDGVENGTYIEVQAIYRSTNSLRPGNGIIKYRFMLGKDIYTDYNAERNHHYKLTLRFNKFANDVDWHIEYKQQVLEVTQPDDVFNFDYQGKAFVPDYSRPNLGHQFNRVNVVCVTSYIEDNEGKMEDIKIKYRDLKRGDTEFSENCDWLDYTTEPGDHPYETKVKFYINENFLKPDEEIDINEKLKKAPPKGSKETPYNLAHPDGTPDHIVCTSNCYMVDAPGWYIFPLVYGNAIHNGQINESAYKYTGGNTGGNVLSVFRNHLDNPITSPYIKENVGCNPAKAYLLWQDVQELLRPGFTWDWDPNEIAKAPTYLPDAYNGIGGIRFYVEPGKIKQGNALIAVSDKAPAITDAGAGKFELPDAIWSWHIWITRFDFEESDKTIEVTAHDTNRKFEFMPVNLGWCSEDGEKIKYYKEKECEVQFSAGTKSTTIRIFKKSHIAVTRGNNPYYQWGRKDPFIAANGNLSANKPRWNYIGWEDTNNPPRLTDDSSDENAGNRLTTREALGSLIKHPDTWHNPPRKPGTNGIQWASDNETYSNLWEGRPGTDPSAQTLKTVYDPCPVGYQVSHYNAFTGFTTTGDNTSYSPEWYNVLLKNIAGYDEATQSCGVYSDYLFEFYTNPDKSQSIIFPQTGYRDWDDKVNTYHFGDIGYIWAAGNVKNDDNNSYNFEFSRTDGEGYIRPKNTFYPCDGFPVRPVRNGSHGLDTP